MFQKATASGLAGYHPTTSQCRLT